MSPRIPIMAFCILAILPPPAAAQTVKLGTLAPEGSPWHKALQDLGQRWREISRGRVKLRIYAGGIAGDDPDMVRKIRIGQLHAAALTGGGLTDVVQDVQALQMPMMLRDYAEFDYIRNKIAPKLEAALEAKGFKVLNWADAGWVYFFTQKPVIHPDDLKPLRLFSWVGETALMGAWRDAGYHPVPLPATEIQTALSSGLINAVPATPIAALAFQWFALAPHMTDLKWAPLVGATVISTRMWRRIPAKLRPALLKASRAIGARLRNNIRTLGPRAIAVMKKHGLKVHAVPPGIKKIWEARARKGWPKLIGSIVSAEAVAEVERIRDAFRAAGARRAPR